MTDTDDRSARGNLWKEVWTDRDDDLADWNGYEATLPAEEYQRFVSTTAELVRTHLGLGADDVVGDLGCGTGRIAAEIAPHVRTVHGFDYSDTSNTWRMRSMPMLIASASCATGKQESEK